jgi:chloride channel protein, CIC family
MNHEPDNFETRAEEGSSLLALALLAPVVGAASGLVGAIFRLSLDRADDLRNAIVAWAHGWKFLGFIALTIACAVATATSAWMVRLYAPQASGSGIPHVEAVLRGELPPAPFRLIAVKFLGGLLAIGSGLALGREGPSVQMGASIAHLVGKLFNRNWADCRVLLAAGAGAGLATAFNAPMAGAIFVLEELVRKFEPRIAIAALGASATAISISRVLLGDAPDFHVDTLAYAGAETRPIYFVLGAVAGIMAIVYNRMLLATLAAMGRLNFQPPELRAALVGAMVGILAWFAPDMVGGGDPITQQTLAGVGSLVTISLVFLLRFGLASISYAAGTPGGLFAPMLVLGAQIGLFFGIVCRMAFPDLDIEPVGFAVVGMAAFFTGVVRAPLTGIVLVTEMTANVTMLLPMLGACFVAMLVPTILGNPPIYDSLGENARQQEERRSSPTIVRGTTATESEPR